MRNGFDSSSDRNSVPGLDWQLFMISTEQMMEATALPSVAELSFDAFSKEDLVNLIMQRSEIIFDQPRSGRVVRAWAAGDPEPAMSLVREHGDQLAKRAAAIIFLEYQEIQGAIEHAQPKSVADIGCGYAIFDLFLWRDHNCHLTLIDLEETEERHFGYGETGAAYSSLSVARSFLTQNGVDNDDITCLNPGTDDLSAVGSIDLAMSFISCGFHYPAQTYEDFFRNSVSENGTIILDLRTRRAQEGTKFLGTIGQVSTLVDAARGGAKRVLVRKDRQMPKP
ncbi:class I SAM-dependent methyltransferase [Ruegeria sp. R14_0]|uniref:class I SAM-dependent methyltransferase n=1 Tax=Ruegeria sp. R14_0 TaxID=2821100 RepID=UPI001ADA954C|nr:class I SAM-dependent methyltransferase [Ruegeria sp. R14_0]MBO9448127.1 class I SAM-dependent methyltransferase [Ruegeria sp. R14_0]